MTCRSSCSNFGKFIFPTSNSDGRNILKAWMSGAEDVLKIFYRQSGRTRDALLIKEALFTQSLHGRCVLLLGPPEETKCQAAGRVGRNSRFQGCFYCSLETTESDLTDTLVTFPHVLAQDPGAPPPSKMTVGYILRHIFVRTSSKTPVNLLSYLYEKAFDWMITTPVPKFMVLHVVRLTLRCEAGCKRLACEHLSRAVQQTEATTSGDKIIAIPGMATAWLLVKKGQKFQLLLDVPDDPPMASPVPPQPRADRRSGQVEMSFRHLQPLPHQSLTLAEAATDDAVQPVQLDHDQAAPPPQVVQQPPPMHVRRQLAQPRSVNQPSRTQLFQGQSPRTQSARQTAQARHLGPTQLQLRSPAN